MRLKDIRLIIFDLDGTLIDAYRAISESFNYTMRRLNYPVQRTTDIRRAVGWGDENLLRPFIDEKDLSSALLIYRRHHKKTLPKRSRLFPAARKLLVYLKENGYRLAVASNRPTKFSWILIRRLRLDRYFSYVLCSDRLRHIKPHPEILNKIMRKFSICPEQTLYVGDMVIDAQAGKRARVKTIIITTGSSPRSQIRKEQPYLVINRFSRLFYLL